MVGGGGAAATAANRTLSLLFLSPQSLSDARAKGAALDAQRAYLQETLEENTALVRSVQDLSSKIQSAKAIHESMEVQNQR